MGLVLSTQGAEYIHHSISPMAASILAMTCGDIEETSSSADMAHPSQLLIVSTHMGAEVFAVLFV